MVFFTADLHLGHDNIIKHCNRPFSSVYEMDEHLISQWNAYVHKNDSVYIVGDLIFRNRIRATDYLNRLNGEKHLILGNHDKKWIKQIILEHHFASVEKLLEISHNQHKIVMCHYPMMSWNHMARGSYMIHGHIHNNRDAGYFPLLRQMPNILNAGVDVNSFHPVGLDELIRNNEAFKTEKTKSEVIGEAVKGIGVLAGRMQELTEMALVQYTPIAEDIITGKISGENKIAYHLDYMLDFCFDDTFHSLYNRVLQSLTDKYPELARDYEQYYQEMWGNDSCEDAKEYKYPTRPRAVGHSETVPR